MNEVAHSQRLVEGRLRARLLPFVAAEAAVIAGLAAVVWHAKRPDRLDNEFASVFYAKPGTFVRTIATAVTFLGHPPVVAIAAAAVAAWAWWRFHDRLLTAFCPLAVGLSGLAERTLKTIVARPRPPTAVLAHEIDFSYPSGHVTGSAALALAAILLVWSCGPRRGRAPTITILALYALAVATSRLVLGVHYLTDVVGGALLATTCVLLVGAACSNKAKGPSSRESPPGEDADRVAASHDEAVGTDQKRRRRG